MTELAFVIPARMASTRFPGKPLVDLGGRPMIAHVVAAARAAAEGQPVIVATPDDAIEHYCRGAGIAVQRTRDDHLSGTDRIAEVAETVPARYYINVQGDEPLIAPETIRAVLPPLLSGGAPMATLACRWPAAAREDPSIVKVVTDLRGRALYFSRSGIPFVREPSQVPIWRHLGLYGYSRQVLLEFQSWSPTPLELAEGLEQLRFLENGVTIAVESVEDATPAVDLPEHADTIRQLLQVRAS